MLEERKDASRSVSILLMGDCLLVQHPHLQQIIKPAWISYLHRGATDQTLDEEVLRRKEELYRNFVRYFLRRLFSQNLFAAFRLSSSSSVETVDDLHGQQRSDEASSEDSEIEDLLGSSKIFQTDEERRQIYFLSQLQKACEEHAERQEEEEERLQDEEREEEEEEGRESEGALEITNEKTERGREKKDEREEKTKKREREISQEDEIDIDDAERVLLLQESLLHTKASSSSYGDSSRHQEKERKEEEEEERPLRLLPLGLPKGWRFLSLKPRQAVRVLATEIRDCLEVIEEESAQRKKAIEDSDGETDNNAELKRLLEVTKDLFFFGAGRLLEVTFTREKSDELFHPPIEDHMETASNFFGESVKSLYSDLARKAEAEDDEEHRAALERQQTPPSERELAEDEMLKCMYT
ncbi:transmembrane protein [Cystoisospora suis]|uniref:Transmembrane protein n=1 Tax=Cystoisospora suis TaxID=483139 RepID=A0A2C6KLL6_9APIC|nr:transmembrane protein [Cystoisospora suis]